MAGPQLVPVPVSVGAPRARQPTRRRAGRRAGGVSGARGARTHSERVGRAAARARRAHAFLHGARAARPRQRGAAGARRRHVRLRARHAPVAAAVGGHVRR